MNVYITERGLFSNDRHDYPISHANPVNKVEAPEKVSDNYSVVREVEQAYVAENTPAYNISISSMGKAALQSMVQLSQNFDAYYDQLATDRAEDNTSEDTAVDNRFDNAVQQDNAAQVQENRITDETVNEGIVGTNNDLDTRIEQKIYEPAEDDSLQTIYDNAASDVENDELFEETESTLETEIIEEPGQIDFIEEGIQETAMEEPYQVPDNNEFEPGADKLLQPTIEEQETNEQIKEEARPDNNPVIRQAMAAYNYQMSYSINLAMTQ